MSDPDPDHLPDEPASRVRSITDSTAEGQQSFTIERGKHELRVEAEAHKRRLAEARLEHELEEAKLESADRRHREQVGFYVVVGIAVVGLSVGCLVAVFSNNDETRRWAQSIVTLLLGGVVGGLAGYFTGKVGK